MDGIETLLTLLETPSSGGDHKSTAFLPTFRAWAQRLAPGERKLLLSRMGAVLMSTSPQPRAPLMAEDNHSVESGPIAAAGRRWLG